MPLCYGGGKALFTNTRLHFVQNIGEGPHSTAAETKAVVFSISNGRRTHATIRTPHSPSGIRMPDLQTSSGNDDDDACTDAVIEKRPQNAFAQTKNISKNPMATKAAYRTLLFLFHSHSKQNIPTILYAPMAIHPSILFLSSWHAHALAIISF